MNNCLEFLGPTLPKNYPLCSWGPLAERASKIEDVVLLKSLYLGERGERFTGDAFAGYGMLEANPFKNLADILLPLW